MVPPTLLDSVQTSLIPGKLSLCIQNPTRVLAVPKLRHRLLWELCGAQGLCGVSKCRLCCQTPSPTSLLGISVGKHISPQANLPSCLSGECDDPWKRNNMMREIKKKKLWRRVWGRLVKDPRDGWRELLLLGRWGPGSQMGENLGICLPQRVQTTVPLLPKSQWAWMVALQTLRDHRYHLRLLYLVKVSVIVDREIKTFHSQKN